MSNRITYTFLFILMLLSSCMKFAAVNEQEGKPMISVIPQPAKMDLKSGKFHFDKNVAIVISNQNLLPEAKYLSELVGAQAGIDLEILNSTDKMHSKNSILLQLESAAKMKNKESYQLEIQPEFIKIKAVSNTGIFYGIQTLRQILLLEYSKIASSDSISFPVPSVYIEDYPRYAWRGMMLDVSRHFFPIESVKAFIDYLAMYKINMFHWHLVDDQGWRIEIKKYPRLTEVGAWRVDREDRHWNDRPPQGPGEKATYGGYYTQDDIKEIVAYAQDRHITIVPEIEMPGHTTAALTAYPQFSCSDGPFTVLPGGYWPISDIYCAGKEGTFEFLQNILIEVMDLFPGEYIHIGGDEAEKSSWKKCSYCQERIKNEGLADEHQLQSYFIERMEKFISSKGRKLIGWDEILEGGLAPGSTVMSWRGFQGGVTAARSGHDVVMTPTSHCYFDYYQGSEDHEPLAIGGYLPLKKVYEFDPTPDSLTTDEAKYILGGQANVWTEYIADFGHLQYMSLPRMAALSEAVWTQKKNKNWNNFAYRIENEMRRYDKLNINYAKSSIRVDFDGTADLGNREFFVTLSSELPQMHIRYTMDGSQPDKNAALYEKPIVVNRNVTVKAAVFRESEMISAVYSKSISIHKATGKKVSLLHQPEEKYAGTGNYTLTNSIRGTANHNDGRWLGFEKLDMQAVVDLGELITVNSVSSSYLININSWIFLPSEVVYSISSDGENFEPAAVTKNQKPENYTEKEIVDFPAKLDGKKVRYIKVVAKNVGICPPWHKGAGGKAWLFCDEIIVE